MEHMATRILLTFLYFIAIWLIGIGLVAAAIVFLVKATLITLIPIVGLTYAYIICGILCLLPVLICSTSLRPKAHVRNKQQNTHSELSAEGISKLIQEYPLEAIIFAFTLGFSTEGSEDIMKLTRAASQHGN